MVARHICYSEAESIRCNEINKSEHLLELMGILSLCPRYRMLPVYLDTPTLRTQCFRLEVIHF